MMSCLVSIMALFLKKKVLIGAEEENNSRIELKGHYVSTPTWWNQHPVPGLGSAEPNPDAYNVAFYDLQEDGTYLPAIPKPAPTPTMDAEREPEPDQKQEPESVHETEPEPDPEPEAKPEPEGEPKPKPMLGLAWTPVYPFAGLTQQEKDDQDHAMILDWILPRSEPRSETEKPLFPASWEFEAPVVPSATLPECSTAL
jgi:outer membrane biosynthesis protein TonB